jgi:hypothetical protein
MVIFIYLKIFIFFFGPSTLRRINTISSRWLREIKIILSFISLDYLRKNRKNNINYFIFVKVINYSVTITLFTQLIKNSIHKHDFDRVSNFLVLNKELNCAMIACPFIIANRRFRLVLPLFFCVRAIVFHFELKAYNFPFTLIFISSCLPKLIKFELTIFLLPVWIFKFDIKILTNCFEVISLLL